MSEKRSQSTREVQDSGMGLNGSGNEPPRTPRATMPVGSSTNSSQDGVFGWYQYIQDFTGDFALTWLKSVALNRDLLWEPFSGSGTTLVAAKILGIPSVGYDLNPFMVDVSKAKLDWKIRTESVLRDARRIFNVVTTSETPEPADAVKGKWDSYSENLFLDGVDHYPSDKKLEKWISPQVLLRFQRILSEIDSAEKSVQLFLQVAVASLVVPASNMTFRPNICYEARPTLDFPVARAFLARVEQMVADFETLPRSSQVPARAFLGDARFEGPERADVIFTSPPYPNDMEYIHQTRLELALLSYAQDKSDLTNLKKKMISSSVKLVYRENEWQKIDGIEVEAVRKICEQIAETLVGKNWGWNAADMTAQFFGGMRSVLQNWHNRLSPKALAAVVIGDSAFNGVKVPTDLLLAEVASHHGFKCEDIEVFRTRWNTKHEIELRESVVLLRKL